MCKNHENLKTVPFIVYEATVWKAEKKVKLWKSAAAALACITAGLATAAVVKRGDGWCRR